MQIEQPGGDDALRVGPLGPGQIIEEIPDEFLSRVGCAVCSAGRTRRGASRVASRPRKSITTAARSCHGSRAGVVVMSALSSASAAMAAWVLSVPTSGTDGATPSGGRLGSRGEASLRSPSPAACQEPACAARRAAVDKHGSAPQVLLLAPRRAPPGPPCSSGRTHLPPAVREARRPPLWRWRCSRPRRRRRPIRRGCPRSDVIRVITSSDAARAMWSARHSR